MKFDLLNSVNVRDEFNDNKIRKAWVLQLPEWAKENYTRLPQEVKFPLYADIDREVSQKWVEIMRTHYETSIKNGAKIVMCNAGERLEDAYCVDADEQLYEAGRIIVEEIIENMKKAKNETV